MLSFKSLLDYNEELNLKYYDINKIKVALIGNPNVGKSTIFNALTKLHQHTGNWPGKTVDFAIGKYEYDNVEVALVDLPGTYSLNAHSFEEQVSNDYITKENLDLVVIVCDATSLERNLNLVLQILSKPIKAIVCLNLIDEAKKKQILIDINTLETLLNTKVISTCANTKYGLNTLKKTINTIALDPTYNSRSIHNNINLRSKQIAQQAIQYQSLNHYKRDLRIDKIITNKFYGLIIMLILLSIIFYITIVGANIPSQILSDFFSNFKLHLIDFLNLLNVNGFLLSLIVDGIYTTLTWVVSVMLPPMMIFFPLFALLEDFGYLPRIAFNLDGYFQRSNTCGKQALCMCMGLGCNAVGVSATSIIDSKRERLIAIITNSFMPCNGRFPTLISIITMFIGGVMIEPYGSMLSTLVLCSLILFSVLLTLGVSKVLSNTVLKGVPSSFTLELPPYRKPQIKQVLIRSLLDRTIYVLGRAVSVAIPAGIIIFIIGNVYIDNISLLNYIANILEPIGNIMGLDGIILLAFILGFPANEIVMPIIIMGYLAKGTMIDISDLNILKQLLLDNGWTLVTAINTMIFSIVHFPCATTLLTIKKESKSIKWTILSFILPTIIGIIICYIINIILG
ncbi:MAG: ferrous iron transporter B [Erysipelotrichaceae bacterium]